jgi:hypothetical protein
LTLTDDQQTAIQADHRPEVAIALHLPVWIEAKRGDAESELLSGYALAIGWDRPQNTTYYLVSSLQTPRPVWISEDEVASNSVRPPTV